MDNEEKYKKLIRAIKVLRELKPHDESLENWIKENAPEIAESEDEKVRKALIELVKYAKGNCLALIDKPFNVVPMDAMIAWLEKQDPKKHQEELDAAYKTEYHRGYKAAWKDMGEQNPPMQNGIIINGVAYELIKDEIEGKKDGECIRCALNELCNNKDDAICNFLFGIDLAAHRRFEEKHEL